MKERGILFTAPMVRALLDGIKTQTRRVVKLQIEADEFFTGGWRIDHQHVSMAVDRFNRTSGKPVGGDPVICPYGQPGDRLWVRETWAPHPDFPESVRRSMYRADPECKYDVPRWRPSIHMPRLASRILLEITSVRVERLQDISEADARAEGITPHEVRQFAMFGASAEERAAMRQRAAVAPYRDLWESINGAGSWDANPWVWVVEFRRIEG